MLALLSSILSGLRWCVTFLGKLFPRFFGKLSAWLTGFFGGLFPGLVSGISKLFSNLAKILVAIAAISAALIAFHVAITFLLDKIVVVHLPPDVRVIGAMFMPDNLPFAISTLVLARFKSLVAFWLIRLAEKFERA